MNNDFFEMNELDSCHSIDIQPEKSRNTESSAKNDLSHSHAMQIPSKEVHVEESLSEENNEIASAKSEPSCIPEGKSAKKNINSRKSLIMVSLISAFALVSAVGIVIGIVSHSDNDGYDPNFDMKETVFVTETDSPAIDMISENVLGTGMLFEDSDILSEPDENSAVTGRLSGGTDVLVYAAEGDYYRVGDPEKKVIGYILKDKVNTGGIDLGNPDADSGIADETDKAAGKKKITYTSVNPEDFPVNSSPYFIYVEKGSHTITIFGKDSVTGKYTVPRRTFLTATGRTASLTPVGDFTILAKEKWHSWGNCYSPYCCKYYRGLFFHGPLYSKKNFGTLMRGSVYEIGRNASSGCMRTSAEAAYFIYQFCWVGTNVRIVNGSPLGRSAGAPSVDSQYIDPATNRVPVAEISFDFTDKTMHVGDTIQVTANITPSFADNRDCSWFSSDASVVSVTGNDNSCVIKALKAGGAVITACSIDGGFTASFNVTVLSDESSEDSSDISSAESGDISSNESGDISSNESDDASSAQSDDASSSGEASDNAGSTTETSGTTQTTASSSAPSESNDDNSADD